MRTASMTICTFATGLVLSTLTTPAAMAERPHARSGHLKMPLGAGGPADPIGVTARLLEQRLAQRRSRPAAPLADHVMEGLASVSDDEPTAAEPADDAIASVFASLGVTRDLIPASVARGDKIVLAALAPARGDPIRDVAVRQWEEPGRLPWAAGPSVPSLVSAPVEKSDVTEGRKTLVLHSAVPSPQEYAPEPPLAVPSLLQARAPAPGRRLSELSPLRSSPLPRLPWMSSVPTDPLAALSMDRDGIDAEAQLYREFILPIASGRITSLFNQGRVHPAIDLAAPLGVPVVATTTGQTVTFAGPRGGYGNAVITRDESGRTHLYGHLQSITTTVGALLDQGEQLGKLGSTGFSTGPHVHYEVTAKAGSHIDPAGLLFPGRKVASGLAWGGPEPDRLDRPERQVASATGGQPRPR